MTAAVLAASVGVLAVKAETVDVSRGAVLSRFTQDFLPQEFDTWGLGASFEVVLSQTYEQDCYLNGRGKPRPETYVGVRTGSKRVSGSAPADVDTNSQGVINRFVLTLPSFDGEDAEIEWDGGGSGTPGGSGCPGGPNYASPNGPPRATGAVAIESIHVTIQGITREIDLGN